ncbi:MAG TPA: TIGR04295 family B12-binding domain-containing radical SAM protein [Stellaceae bacterium]|nr:TIGR04295 family B12-binding domain-containing radical SAM protein [Stellaceae bacterium]
MRLALVNPPWSFDGSIYFGCREPHLPLEFGYAQALLAAAGHEAAIFDAQAAGWELAELAATVGGFAPDMVVVTTAPSYLFWRCAPPELRVPQLTLQALSGIGAATVAVGPHGSTTPRSTLAKLRVDAVAIGECEETLVGLASTPQSAWNGIAGVCTRAGGVRGGPQAADMARLPALRWPAETVSQHVHHHHRFDRTPDGPGAEIEASRGCPYHCTFCAKDNFRDAYRRRPLATIVDELDGLIAQGAAYVYFVDEIFLPWRQLLEALRERPVEFGVQTRVDLWRPDMLDLLGQAGCVSIEAGVESLSEAGRGRLDKDCRLSTAELTARLVHAKRTVPFVQANLIAGAGDDPEEIAGWRDALRREGVWANEPVPLFPYPGSPEYGLLWGLPDDDAWERALDWYLGRYAAFSDIQEARPRRLHELELGA